MYFQVFLIIYMFIRQQHSRVHSLFDLPGMSEGLTFFLLFSNRLYPKIPATCFSNRIQVISFGIETNRMVPTCTLKIVTYLYRYR